MPEHDNNSDRSIGPLETTALLSSPNKNTNNVNYTALNDDTAFLEEDDTVQEQLEGTDNDDDNDNYLKQGLRDLPWRKRPSYKILLFAMLLLIVGLCTSVSSLIDILTNMVCKEYYKSADPNAPQITPIDSPLGPFSVSHVSAFVTLGDNLLRSDPRCNSAKITSLVGIFQTYITTTTGILNLVSIPLLSSYADRWGRKPVLIFSGCCIFLSSFLSLAVCVWPDAFNYHTLLFTGILDGVGGSMLMIIIMASSYVADIVKESQRAKILSIQDAIYSGGMAIGPIIGSYIFAYTNNLTILFGIGCFSTFLFLLIVIFLLPESRSEKSRRQSIAAHAARRTSFLKTRKTRLASSEINEEDLSIFSKAGLVEKFHEIYHLLNFVEPLKVLKFSHIKEPKFKRNAYLLIFGQTLLTGAITSGVPFILLLSKTRFQWDSVQNNYLISILGGTRFITLSVILPRVLDYVRHQWFHSPVTIDRGDKTVLTGSLILSTLGYFLVSESNTGQLFMASMAFLALGSGTSPIIRNSLIKYSPRNKVAEVLGAANMIATILSVFTPTLFAMVYTYTAEYRPQATIEVLVFCEFTVLAVACFLHVQENDSEVVN
jgi:MFS family permease